MRSPTGCHPGRRQKGNCESEPAARPAPGQRARAWENMPGCRFRRTARSPRASRRRAAVSASSGAHVPRARTGVHLLRGHALAIVVGAAEPDASVRTRERAARRSASRFNLELHLRAFLEYVGVWLPEKLRHALVRDAARTEPCGTRRAQIVQPKFNSPQVGS